ncbi:PEPxxWA-CTERM sorting domain-containing protein [Sphingomonas sp. DT-51]|uniref:PEPxxWA-CTERM sorting domain-containing protein n=1 Tax=Sphingomonas sp. DT-51 TaxID=3396165 RepID=UPI003F5411F3
MDATGDFLPSYTAGPPLADLDVTSFSVNYDAAGKFFTLGATFAGAIDAMTAGLYVIGVNTGTGTIRPFAPIGQENVIFNQAIVLRKDGTGSVGATALDPGAISIAGNIITARVGEALLPSTGFTAANYGFNLWPRIGLGNNAQITDFAPNNANLSTNGLQGAVPEPATWALMILGFGVVGAALRRRRMIGSSEAAIVPA